MSEKTLYTFVPVAPCTFSLQGKHYSAKAGTPIQVELPIAKIIASNNFLYRKHLKLITPLPKEEKKAPDIKVVPPKPSADLKVEPKVEVKTSVKTVELPKEEVKEVEVPVEPKVEEAPPTPKKRTRKKAAPKVDEPSKVSESIKDLLGSE